MAHFFVPCIRAEPIFNELMKVSMLLLVVRCGFFALVKV